MARRITDAELAARCTCGVPLDEPLAHRSVCRVYQRAYDKGRTTPAAHDALARRAAAELARLLSDARAHLAAGGRPS
jgi:hypothetical protein